MTQENPVYSVSEIAGALRRTLEANYSRVRIRGEISNFRNPASGHFYFALKDSQAQLKAVMFRSAAIGLRFLPGDGLEVEAEGDITVYEPRGDMQILVRRMEPSGIGALMRAFEALKSRLEKEGLFAAERKRPLPRFPGVIGIVTSRSGAAIHDLMHLLSNRWPAAELVLRPALVQGPDAAADIAEGIRSMNRWGKADVLIVGRGGGSLEDLWAFNEEPVARAIAESRIPVVSAVGHETDITIADLVADVRAATPSAAAEQVTPHQDEVRDRFRALDRKLHRRVWDTMRSGRERLNQLGSAYGFRRPEQFLRREEDKVTEFAQRLRRVVQEQVASHRTESQDLGRRLDRHHPRGVLASARSEMDTLGSRLHHAVQQGVQSGSTRVTSVRASLRALNPSSVLKRGFSLVREEDSRALVTTAKQLSPGSAITVQFHTDRLRGRVETVEPGGPPELENADTDG